MAVQPRQWPITVEVFERMVESGILGEGDRVELIDGSILEMNPVGSQHAACVMRLAEWFIRRLGEGRAIVGVQSPVRIGDLSEPEPDLFVARPLDSYYAEAHPGPEDLLLLVEVSDSSLAYDRAVKAPLYARGGVPELWIVDLQAGVLEVSRSPSAQGYQHVTEIRAGESVTPLLLPDLLLDPATVLPA